MSDRRCPLDPGEHEEAECEFSTQDRTSSNLPTQRRQSCASRTTNVQVRLGSVVEHQHQGTADTAERVSNEPLVEAGGNALLRGDLLQAISSALVDVLLNWLFCLHLETPADSVEGIAGTGAQMMAVCAAANVEAK